MSGPPPSYRIFEIDQTDDAALQQLVEFESEHGAGRRHTVEELRSLIGTLDEAIFVVALRAGEWAAVLSGSTQLGDGGLGVHMRVAVGPGSQGALEQLVDHVATWPAARNAHDLVIHLADPTNEDIGPWIELGFKRAGMRRSWQRTVHRHEQVEAPVIGGLRIASLASHPELEVSAHAAWCDAHSAIPDDLVSRHTPTFEDWRSELVRDGSGAIPQSFLVAIDPRGRVVGVGYLHVHVSPPCAAGHYFTGVVSDWRGRGVARMLKVAQINWAARNGITELRGSNNEHNHAMLHINEQLGYEPVSTIVMLSRTLR